MNHKQKIRQDILNKRRKLDESIVNYHSDLISRRVCQSTLFQHASTLFIYVNYQNEVKTTPIIREAFRLNKTVAIPKIINHSMEFYKINSLEEVARGTFNILEPTTTERVTDKKGVMIMPGVAFDRCCHRIGYGKGFYDRYLKNFPELITIALAYECQIVDSIAYEPHDICPQYIFTECQIYTKRSET
ncbi:5-formyltetrahydrofolate cyclo-ligase [Turicibacter faecis]|uniref:5-formyltetrahydrofolate cyclo-ligase n=1 Tax=Turicibacter faecis TaxID=2963365 RepID=A0ABN6Z8L8_9FIRM|nr:5-formyltetrahydrofolate cyclo-ligase [Turicibacter sp. TS3]NCE78439.1 5-formyltetrahydrofolate cyclo-ligase [Turicibacter sp. TS3]BEH90212.1 5-formyltetrahydrofolate cyclo-ligase [Turicibacter sp. TC023]